MAATVAALVAPSAGHGQSVCIGDCSGDGQVSITELIVGVNIALGGTSLDACPAFDCPQPLGGVFVNCLVDAVENGLSGCQTPRTTPTPTAASGFRICGKAAERPGPNPPLARFVLVTLNPLGLVENSLSSGIFCFEDVPPGDYTISVVEYQGAPSHCTAYGCWQDTPVTVVDSDIQNVFVVMLGSGTPTATPTPTPTHGCTPTTAPTFEPHGGRCRTVADCGFSGSGGVCLRWDEYLARDSCHRKPAIPCDGAMACPPNFTCGTSGACVRVACVCDDDCDHAYCVQRQCNEELGICGFFPP
jgi:hypothetical protein